MRTQVLATQRLAGLAFLALLMGLAACGGGGTGSDPPPSAPDQQALAVSRSGELVAYAQRKLRERAAGSAFDPGVVRDVNGDFALAAAPSTAVAVTAVEKATPAFASTLTQEDAVDEADLLKTDGRLLFALDPGQSTQPQLQVHQRSADGALTALSSAPLRMDGINGIQLQGLLLAPGATAAAVLGQAWLPIPWDVVCGGLVCPADAMPGAASLVAPSWLASRVVVQRFDATQPNQLKAGTQVALEGYLVSSRQIGPYLVVVSTHRPRLPVDFLPADASTATREATIAALRAEDLLPKVQVNGGAARPLLADTDCWVQTANASSDVALTTVTVFDLASADLAFRSRCFVGGSEAVYMSASHLYLASTTQGYTVTAQGWVYPTQMQTQIHKFSFAGGTLAYRGSGSVDGHLGWSTERKSYRMSEHEGDLRVLSFTGPMGWITLADSAQAAPSPCHADHPA